MSWGGRRQLSKLQEKNPDIVIPSTETEDQQQADGEDREDTASIASASCSGVERPDSSDNLQKQSDSRASSSASHPAYQSSELGILNNAWKENMGLKKKEVSKAGTFNSNTICQAYVTNKKLSDLNDESTTAPVSKPIVDYSPSSASKPPSLVAAQTPTRLGDAADSSVLKSIENVRRTLGYRRSPALPTIPETLEGSTSNNGNEQRSVSEVASDSSKPGLQNSGTKSGFDTFKQPSRISKGNKKASVEFLAPVKSVKTPSKSSIGQKSLPQSSVVSPSPCTTGKKERSRNNVESLLDDSTASSGSGQVIKTTVSKGNIFLKLKAERDARVRTLNKERAEKILHQNNGQLRRSARKCSQTNYCDQSPKDNLSGNALNAMSSGLFFYFAMKEFLIEVISDTGSNTNSHFDFGSEFSDETNSFRLHSEKDSDEETDQSNTAVQPEEPKISSSQARLIRKLKRNSGKSYVTDKGIEIQAKRPMVPECAHKAKIYECGVIKQDSAEALHSEYWNFANYDKRVQYMSNLMVVLTPARNRSRKAQKSRLQTVQYYVVVDGIKYRVCQKAIMKIFDVKAKFLNGVADKKANSISGVPANDMRGKSKSSRKNLSVPTIAAVKDHINSFPAYVSHYSRQESSQRYLASYLTLRKMHKRYLEENNPKVSYSKYRSIFKSMGLKFKEPKSDTCASCDAFHIRLKGCSGEEKEAVERELQHHQNKAQKAYQIKRKKIAEAKLDPTKVTIVFDLEQCLPVPDLPTGKVYYSRQLYAYNLTIVQGQTTFCYMWAEHEGKRGANEIASCIFHYITTEMGENVTELTLFSDCCSGQNRNSIICSMLLTALQDRRTSLQTIDHIFLVPGHTRMECDSRHSLIERYKKRSEDMAIVPSDWYKIVESAGNGNFTVIHMKDHFYDFQRLLESKDNGPLIKRDKDTDKSEFRYLETFWFRYKKSLKGIVQVKSDHMEDSPFCHVDFLRKGRKVSHIRKELIRIEDNSNPISTKKKEDLCKLFNLIEPRHHAFYLSLRTDNTLVDFNYDIRPEEVVDDAAALSEEREKY
ncbi:hypothetical protein FOCC_FOCC002099 [Frankliniella occidentalis]|nr:hypothetical protein FOCC_FOCC002099 [Frankliniella occidentalis]